MEDQRNLSLDILKIILAVSVVFLHCHFLKNISNIGYFSTVEGLFRLAVPTFLIISGFYFFNITCLSKLKKWAIRLGLLYLIWMLIYSPYWLDLNNIPKTIYIFFNGYYILWYLIGVLFSGFFVYLIRNLSTKIHIFLILILFFMGCIIQLLGNLHILNRYLDEIFNMNAVHRNFLLFCIPFFLTGYLINKYKIFNKIEVNLPMLIIVLSLVVLESNLNRIFVSSSENLDQLFSLIIASPILFTYFKNKNLKIKSKNLANLSSAIYLVHPMILFSLSYYIILDETISSFIVLILAIIVGNLLIYLNKKLKYII
ncbi:acyltransferase family protein [Acinetobacter sp. SFD]|uniref:acyltransferase family protein n=1 Tax=Acinetobacter sp. SFD TaxID=1805635 RepID=UPI0007D0735E|nr:acyltransferase [Acinetobacter sp. SFD]